MNHGFESLETTGGRRWIKDQPPAIHHEDLQLAPQPFVTGWNRAIQRDVPVPARSLPLGIVRPKTICIPIQSPRVPVRSFLFSEPASLAGRFAAAGGEQPTAGSSAARPPGATLRSTT